MFLSKLIAPVTRLIGKAKFQAIDKEPQICFIMATAAGALSLYAMYKNGPKFKQIIEEHNEYLDEQEKYAKAVESGEIVPENGYTKEDSRNDRLIHGYARTGIRLMLNAAPIALAAGASVSLYARGYGVLTGRYIGMASAYAAVLKEKLSIEESLKKSFGQEGYDKVMGKEKTQIVDENTGEVSEVKATSDDVGAIRWSFSRFFDETNPNWSKSPQDNRFFLERKLAYARHLLTTRGYLFINEVFDMLGMPLSDYGQMFGWRYYKDPKEAEFNGCANDVSFGLEVNKGEASQSVRDFVNGYERSILLEFNIDPMPLIGRTGMPKY